MPRTIELSETTEQTLEQSAKQRGVSVEDLMREIIEGYTLSRKKHVSAASIRGKYAGVGNSVDELLHERREEATREMDKQAGTS